MWWRELEQRPAASDPPLPAEDALQIHPTAEIAADAHFDTSRGPIVIGPRTRVCHGAFIMGPVRIGADCTVGNLAMIRGETTIGDGVRIGFATEIKNAIIEQEVTIGPQCFVADSKIERDAYLGAQVRTSNHRLDGRTIEVLVDGQRVDTGREKLGCLVGRGSALGIQVVVLPGRVVAPGSVFAPRTIVERNLTTGRYRLAQQLETF